MKGDENMEITLRGWEASFKLEVEEVFGGDLIIPKEELIWLLDEAGKRFDAFELVVKD